MSIKKFLLRIVLFLWFIVLAYGIYYAWFSFPIISGFSAKNACSCTFIQGRTKEAIVKEELGMFPLSLGNIDVNIKDSSVTGSVWGLAKRKAIYRAGFGCTLVNDIPEPTLRSPSFPLSLPTTKNDSLYWPNGDRLSKNNTLSFNEAKLDSAIAFAFQHKPEGKEAHTRAVLVVHRGHIIAEQYAPGYTQHSKFLGWSMAKSITGALIGVLVKEGRLDIGRPAPVQEWKEAEDKRHAITVEHLLQQTSGLDFTEDYASYSNVTNMLFNKGNMAAYTASLPLKHKPGSTFYYSSGNSNLLSRIIRTTVGEHQYHAFPYKALFHKIGMFHTLLEPDASGTYVGSSYVYASARDYARFGLLYLNQGVWNGERILPEGWVQKTITPVAANPMKNYGYQFWLKGVNEADSSSIKLSAPADLFMADGYGGQRLFIIPSMQLVVVRLGLNKFNDYEFLEKVIGAMVP